MSAAWKSLERVVAAKLGGRRKVRGDNFAVSDFDVDLPDFPHFRVDAKYRSAQQWKHHAMLKEVAKKYCKRPGDVPVLVTKNGREHGEYVTLRLEDFASLLNALRVARESLPLAKDALPPASLDGRAYNDSVRLYREEPA